MAGNLMSSEQVVAATFLLPASSAEPLIIELPHHALRLVVVNNGSVGLLDDSWDAGGVYILLGSAEQRDHYSAYVGKAPSGLRSRVGHHVRSKEGWDRALLVSHTSYGFSSAAVGWLEGRLWDVLTAAPAAELRNQVRPRDETLPPWERLELERYITPITAVLRALGANPDTPDQAPARRRARGPRRSYSETVADLLDAGMLTVGARLRPLPEAFDTPATVLDAGRLEVNGALFETPSAAGVQIVGRQVNGWDFWGAASGDGTLVPLSELRRRLRANGAGQPAEGAEDLPAEGAAEPVEESASDQEYARAGERPAAAADEARTAEPDAPAVARRRPRRVDGTVAAIVAAGLLESPTIFATYKGTRYEATAHGENGLALADGPTFNSLSLAAAHITQRPTNGWTFWKTQKDGKAVALASLRAMLTSEPVE
jgi:hypothetical protein